MISEEQKKEIISMWKKESNISKISRLTKVSRPIVRKIVKQYLENRKWWLTRTYMDDGFVRLVINTTHTNNREDTTAVERLALGATHYEVDKLIRSIIKRPTADEILKNFGRDPPRISILHLKKTELLPEIRL